mmetsp:Transcript_16600/g.26861  ORF Transcript_16600/g.26861 Transcript_16600/m.26861 type:complete len:196 (-) Transcript_16600:81-668(-)
MRAAPREASIDTATIVPSYGSPDESPTPRTNQGNAVPNVNAPTKTPKRAPRPSGYSCAAIFIPTGYTPASVNPTTVRNTTHAAKFDLATKHAALNTAPISVKTAKSAGGEKRSATAKYVSVSVPKMNPAWTHDVRAETCSRPKPTSDTTALGANHSDVPANWAKTIVGRTSQSRTAIAFRSTMTRISQIFPLAVT